MIYLDVILFCFIFLITCILIYIKWARLARVYHQNYSFFEVFFDLLYPFEEIIFVLLYSLKPELSNLWINLILIAIFSTFVIDKYLTKKQYQHVADIKKNQEEKLKDHYYEIIDKSEKKISSLTEDKDFLLDQIVLLQKENKELKKHRTK